MLLPHGLTEQEIRILQEFRRITVKSMTLSEIAGIRHPVGGGEAPAWALVTKGFLAADPGGASVSLTERGEEFLSYDPKPAVEGASAE
jgi:hypothetical protein